MFPTFEVRWFCPGQVPTPVLDWFARNVREPELQPARIDHYLRLGVQDALGIKLREGRIEIKRRQHNYGVVRFHERVAGLMEHWHKWSLELAQPTCHPTDICTPTSAWIGVQKERKLCRYQVTSDGEILAVSSGFASAGECSLELTNIRVGEQEWWSLGFEAYGYEATLRHHLLLVTDHVLSENQPPILDTAHSYSYPKWLGIADR